MRRAAAVIIAFVLGVAVSIAAAPKQTQAKAPAKRYKTYTIDFSNGKKCEFCGCKPAEWYELSARKSSGTVTAEYYCSSCREFCRYK